MAASAPTKAFDVALLSPRAGEEERVQLGISREGVTLLQTDGTVSDNAFTATHVHQGHRPHDTSVYAAVKLPHRHYQLNFCAFWQVLDTFPFTRIAKWLSADKRTQGPGEAPGLWLRTCVERAVSPQKTRSGLRSWENR